MGSIIRDAIKSREEIKLTAHNGCKKETKSAKKFW